MSQIESSYVFEVAADKIAPLSRHEDFKKLGKIISNTYIWSVLPQTVSNNGSFYAHR